MGELTSDEGRPQPSAANASPKNDLPDVTRFRSAAAKRASGAPPAGPHGATMPYRFG